MCGIAGIFWIGHDEAAHLELARMMEVQNHRGPDGSGVETVASSDPHLIFGHHRLAIIDLSETGSQPMFTEDRKTAIVYNGEIYNFRDLRADLHRSGIEFRSQSDTEVLLYGFRQWGIDGLLARLRGMFSFALYDSRSRDPELYLVRDRFGIKPLYYIAEQNRISFASESRALLRQMSEPMIDQQALALFLIFGSVPAPRTIWKNVKSIMPAEYIRITNVSNELKCDSIRYWSERNDPDAGSTNVAELIRDSVQLHLVSDVPVGVFLSGGLDSSAIAALASQKQRVQTIHVRFEEQEFDESRYADSVASHLHTLHSSVTVTEKDFQAELPRILNAIDQPTVDGINTYFVAAAARKAGLKVVLSGLGADEVFLGYPYHKKFAANRLALSAFFKQPRALRAGTVQAVTALQNLRGRSSWRRLDYLQSANPLGIYAAVRGVFSPDEIQKLCGISNSGLRTLLDDAYHLFPDVSAKDESLLSRINRLDFHIYLANQLLRDSDVMSMCHSVELRVPFLDHVLVETVRRLPEQQKIKPGINKHLLVNAVASLLPEETWKRKKMGFAFPLQFWFRNSLNQINSGIEASSLFDAKESNKVMSEFNNGKAHWSKVMALMTASSANQRLLYGHFASRT